MAERVSGEGEARKTRVFISYSRANIAFTDQLAGQLIGRGYKVDYDRTHFDSDNIDTGISAEDDWWKRLQEMIAACEAMVFVVSPDSAASRVCDEEIAYARALGKRIIPILLREIDFSKAPPRLAALNVKLSFEDENAFEASLAALTKALDVDVAWHREGARLMALAAKWDTAGRSDSLLLPSGAVTDAEAWAARRPAKAEPPGELFAAYLAASGAKAKADRDRLLKSTGRAFVRPAEQALAEGRYDKALRLAAAGILLGEDFDLQLVPELALSALNAAAASRWGHVFREGGVRSAKLSSDGRRIVTASHDGVLRVWDAVSGRQISASRGQGGLIVSIVVFSPDGGRIAYTSDDWKARVLDAADGRVLAVLQGHERGIADLSFSPDGKRVVTVGHDRTGRVWDAADGKEIAVLNGHRASVVAAMFSPDGKRVVTASEDNTARVWDASRGRHLAVLRGHTGWVFKAVFNPDGANVATASNDSTARVWNAASGRQIRILRGHSGAVNDVAYSADGSSIVTASHDKTARVWNAASGREAAILRGHENLIQCASFSPDGARVVTASPDDTARVWDAVSGDALCILRGHEGAVEGAEFTADGLYVLTTSPGDGTARLWDSAAAPQIAVLRGHKGSVSAAFSPDGQRLLSAGVDGTARIWAADSGREAALLKHGQGLYGAEFSPDGRLVVTQCYDNKAYVWDAGSGRQIAVCPERKREITRAAFSRDGARIVTSSRIPTEAGGRTTRIWERSGREIAVLRGEYSDLSPDGARILTVDENDAVVWDGATYRERVVLRGHANWIRWALFSPDGARIATASDDGTIRLWNADSGEQVAQAEVRGSVLDLAFRPDGASILAACENDAVRWDAMTAQTVVFRGHRDGIMSVEFSPDSTRVLTASRDHTARIWDAATGREVARLRGHDGNVHSASFSPDGERVVTASDDGTVRLWAVGHTRDLLGNVAEVVAAALVGGRGVRAQAERGDLLMQGVEASDDDLCSALISRMARSDPDAAAHVAARAERLRKPLHPDCYVPQSRRSSRS